MITLRRVAGVLAALAIGLSAGCTGQQVSQPSDDVAILVLDRFPGGSEAPTPQRTQGGQVAHCAKSGLPANEVGSGGGGDGLPPGVTHGEAVFDTVAAELNAQPRLAPDPAVNVPDSSAVRVWRHQDNRRRIVVVGVNIENYDTALMADRIDAFLSNLKYGPLKIVKVVLNMSFVIVPCDLDSWWHANGDPDEDVAEMIGAFRKNIENDQGVEGLKTTLDGLIKVVKPIKVADLRADPALDRISDVVLTNLYLGALAEDLKAVREGSQSPGPALSAFANDVLRKRLAAYANPGRQVIPVAAAGNGILGPGKRTRTTFDFPFAPALWSSVVSVSAGTAAGPRRLDYSNSGEVMMAPTNKWRARGTSFAAPHLSALEALYLLNGGTAQCSGNTPTLGYANSDNNVFTWDNLWLDHGSAAGTATQKCGFFSNVVTA